MEKEQIERRIQLLTIKQLIDKQNQYYVPVAASNRHVHLSEQDIKTLFGNGYSLKQKKDLSQPGQYACEEVLTLAGPKGRIDKIRVLGPARKETQVEMSVTDSYKVGIKPMIRMSGNLDGTPGGKLIGPNGEVDLQKGVIVSARHLHMSTEEAEWFGLKNADTVSVRKTGQRALVLENIAVRVGTADRTVYG